MLRRLGYADLDELADNTVPAAIRLDEPLELTGLEGLATRRVSIARKAARDRL